MQPKPVILAHAERWLREIKEDAGYTGDDTVFLECYQLSKWKVQADLMVGPLTIAARYIIDTRTGSTRRTI